MMKPQPTLPNCFGVACEKHGQCQRYHAVDGSIGHPRTIGHCLDGNGARPLFVPIKVAS